MTALEDFLRGIGSTIVSGGSTGTSSSKSSSIEWWIWVMESCGTTDWDWIKGSKRGLTAGTQEIGMEQGCWTELFELETKGNTLSWNVTSLETKTVWELTSKTLKPLTLKGKPRKTLPCPWRKFGSGLRNGGCKT